MTMTTDEQIQQLRGQLEEQQEKIQQFEKELAEVKGPTPEERAREEKRRTGMYDNL